MAAQTFSARAVALAVSKRVGRKVTDKQVRAYVRSAIDAYDDGEYTSHQYSAALAKRIEDAMVAKRKGARSAAAQTGRPAAKPRAKRAPVAPAAPSE